jgi:hypothetical protein
MFTDIMVNFGFNSQGDNFRMDVVAYTATLANPSDPNMLIQESIDRHYSQDVSQNVKGYLKSILLNGQLTDNYWTDAWLDYMNAPTNMTFYNIVLTRLRTMYKYLMNLSEYQLS